MTLFREPLETSLFSLEKYWKRRTENIIVSTPPLNDKAANEADIRAAFEEWLEAVRFRDTDKLMSGYTAGVRFFDVGGVLRYEGIQSIRQSIEEWFSSFQSNLSYEVLSLDITASESISIAQSFNHVTAKKKDGAEINIWWRSTLHYRKIEGNWMITHQHNSIPFPINPRQTYFDFISNNHIRRELVE